VAVAREEPQVRHGDFQQPRSKAAAQQALLEGRPEVAREECQDLDAHDEN
jgi:hypothetical protein